MGGVSLAEVVLAVLLLLPILGIVFLVRSSRFRTWLMGKSEDPHFRRPKGTQRTDKADRG